MDRAAQSICIVLVALAPSAAEDTPVPGGGGAPIFRSRPGDWPMWGSGPSRNLVNDHEKGIPHFWDVKTKKNIQWVASLGSQSYGSPVIAEGRILVGTNNQLERNPKIRGDKGVLMCFREAGGEFLWQAVHDKLESGRVNDWPEQGICSVPVVEGGLAYYVSNRAEVVCLDLEGFLDGENDGPFKEEKYKDSIDGDVIWILDMIRELGVFPHNMANCSPLIVRDMLYVITSNGVDADEVTIPSPRAPSFLALAKATGKVAWQSSAPGEKILNGQWSCPTYIEAGGREQVIFPGGDGWLRSFDPLKGTILWEFDANPKDSVREPGGAGTRSQLVATPVASGGKIFIGSGDDPESGDGPGHLYSIDASKLGDITESGKVWHRGNEDFHRTIATVAVKDGLVYAADLTGYLSCLDEGTGKLLWKYDTLASIWGSPTWIDGKIYLGDLDGDVAVLKAGKTLEKIAEPNMESSVFSTPVAAHGVLYITTKTHLYAIASAAAAPAPTAREAAASEAKAPESKGQDSWPSFRGDARLHGWRPQSVPDAAPRLLWTFDAKTEIESTAAVVDGKATLGTADAGLLCLDLSPGGKAGKELWRFKVEGGIRSSPLVAGTKAFFGDDGGVFHAVDLKTGAEAWKFATEGGQEIISSANSSGDSILFGSYDSYLYCLAADTGQLRWKHETQGPLHASPAVEDGKTFVAGCDHQLRVLEIATGKEVGALEMGDYSAASPAVLGDRLFVGTFGGQVLCVDWKALKILWTFESAESQLPFYASPAVGTLPGSKEQVVVVGGRDKRVRALRAADGKEIWSFPAKRNFDASPIIAGGRVLAPNLDGTLFCLDLATGKEVWKFAGDGPFASSPALAEGKLVISNQDGLVHCFDLRGGKEDK